MQETKSTIQPVIPRAKILIVDDKKTNIQILEAMIEDGGHPVELISTTRPSEGFKLSQEHDFALALLDVQMPEMDGYALSTLLRTQPKTAVLPIILVTATSDSQSNIFKGYESGVVDYLIKPISAPLLDNKIRTFVDLYQKHQALVIANETAELLRKEAEEARQAADAANQSKSQFLATISHEIRTPLNSIIGFSELLVTRGHTLSDDNQKMYQTVIHDCSSQLLSLVNNVLDLTKIEAGHEEVNLATFALAERLKNLIAGYQLKAKDKNIIVSLKTEDDLPNLIECDQTKLYQILNNLLGNAVKFTSEGGVITLDISHYQQTLTFRVVDSGDGISEARQEAIFSPFVQESARSNDNVKGTGLGLAISRKLAEMLGGGLSLVSEVGKGSCFTLEIPLVEVKVALIEAEEVLPMNFANGSRVLVVDDVDTNLMLICALIERYGVTVEQAKSGQQAIDKTIELCRQETPPELILMDMHMPGMNGIEATKAILAMPMSANIPVVALSADAVVDQLNRSKGIGFRDYLTKPIVIDALHRVLMQYLKAA
ncbi:MAG: signal transduction histidine kinase [Phenylobacterium sp.]|jgi:signal transduction histidine kinase